MKAHDSRASDDADDVARRAQSGGAGLDAEQRRPFERAFGADFGAVRLHTGADARRDASRLGAMAFTVGGHISLSAGAAATTSADGRRLLAHELAHVTQSRRAASQPAVAVSSPADAAEREADAVATAFAADRPLPQVTAIPTASIARDVDDPDHPPATAAPREPEVSLEPLAEWTPTVEPDDPARLWIPGEFTREQVAQRLYGDGSHFGGFDYLTAHSVRLRNLDQLVPALAAQVRAVFDGRLPRDVRTVVEILKQRRIDGDDEWRLVNITEWWASRSEFTNAAGRSYFDRYLDLLDAVQLEEWGLFSNTTRSATEWLIIEAEEKKSAIFPLLGRRSTRPGPVRDPEHGEQDGFSRVTGPITAAPRPYQETPRAVGTFTAFSGEDRFAISSVSHWEASIQVGPLLLVNEASANAAEIALRNTATTHGRVMIPGGDGRFYGYSIEYPRFWEADYVQPSNTDAPRLERFWWHYPGTVFIPGGSFQAEFGSGSPADRAQRARILTSALGQGLPGLRELDFDVLSTLTFDQRILAIGLAAGSAAAADISLMVRLLYSTPASEFAALEHRLSTNGTMTKLLNTPASSGGMAMIGRVFTMKAVEAAQVPGENLQSLTEFTVGFDQDGYYHYAYPKPTTVSSNLLAATDVVAGVRIGHEQAGAGEAAGPINRTATIMQPAIFRIGGAAGNFYRGLRGTMVEDNGPASGPFLPTQLVRVTTLGAAPQTRVVTVLEAVGVLELPTGQMRDRLISAHIQGGMVVLGGLGLVKVFGAAILEGAASGGGARAVASGIAEAAVAPAGRAALFNAGLLTGMSLVESFRSQLQRSAEGRAFLEIYDVAAIVMVGRDLGRLIGSGLIPRLAAAADRVMALPGVLGEVVMPLRNEVEALRRVLSRYASPSEAVAALTAEGLSAAAPAGARPGFYQLLRVARGEVAAERLVGKLAGTPVEATGRQVVDRLGSLVTRSETAGARVVGNTEEAEAARAAHARQAQSAADAQFAVAQRAAQLRPDAREAFLRAVADVMRSRPNSLAALTDLLTAAAQSRTPTAFLADVQRLVNRAGVSDEALLVLGRKVREGRDVLDLAWLNRTAITDETLDFLGRDRRTNWDLFRRAAQSPNDADVIRYFRTSARGAGAELVGEGVAARLGTDVRRQVPMGSSELDFRVTVAGRQRALEIKGWTRQTWDEALEAAIERQNHRALSPEQRRAVAKIDSMLGQLQDAKQATGAAPFLGFTDDLSAASQAKLRRILQANGLAGTEFVTLPERAIKEAAAGTIGEALGVPRP